jgi:hypothetical protein
LQANEENHAPSKKPVDGMVQRRKNILNDVGKNKESCDPQVCELPIKIVYSRGEFGEWIGKALA